MSTHVNTGCGGVELVFGQGRRGRWGQPWWGALVQEDAAVGETVPTQVPASRCAHAHTQTHT